MPIEQAESIYRLIQVALFVAAAGSMLYLYRNFSSDKVLSRPEALSRGQLKNVVAFARLTMKHSSPIGSRYRDAKRRHEAAQAEIDRRLGAPAAGSRPGT